MSDLIPHIFIVAGCYLAYKIYVQLGAPQRQRPSTLEIVKTREELKRLINMNEQQVRDYNAKKEAYDAKYRNGNNDGDSSR